MGCIIKIGNQFVPETDFLNHLNKIISINKLFEENPDFSSQIYEALGVRPANIGFNIEPFGKSIDNIDVIKDGKKIGYAQISKNNNTKTLIVTGIELKEKGFGKNVYLKLQQQYPDFTIKSDSKNLSEAAIKMWDSLVSKKLATKQGDRQYTLNTKQAQQLYSQYLDIIFPDSKVTLSKKFADTYNIVFNGETIGTIDIPSNLEGDTISIGDVNIKPEFRGKGLGVETYKAAMKIAGKPLESFMATDEANRVWNSLINQGLAKKTDTGFITTSPLLGSKQDIEGFKEFVEKDKVEELPYEISYKNLLNLKPSTEITEEDWDNLTPEEQNELIQQTKNC